MLVRAAMRAMATRFEAVLAGGDAQRLRALAEAAFDEVREVERRLDLFSRGSLLAHVNAHADAGWVGVDADTFELLARCAAAHRASGGAFDPTVGPLMRALGFHGGVRGSAEEVAAARCATGMDSVQLDPARCAVRFARAGMRLDLGAAAKGHALDLAAALLRAHGVRSALLHGGTSTVVALGAPPGQAAWRVRVGAGPEAPVAVLRDAALSVSAPHGRVVRDGARVLGHVLDPRRGDAAEGCALAAVLCARATEADVWSTALLAAGGRLAQPPGTAMLVLGAGGPCVRGRAPAPSRFLCGAAAPPAVPVVSAEPHA